MSGLVEIVSVQSSSTNPRGNSFDSSLHLMFTGRQRLQARTRLFNMIRVFLCTNQGLFGKQWRAHATPVIDADSTGATRATESGKTPRPRVHRDITRKHRDDEALCNAAFPSSDLVRDNVSQGENEAREIAPRLHYHVSPRPAWLGIS